MGGRIAVGPLSTLRFGVGKLRFFGFEGPVRDMDTQKVVLRVHLAKVHVLCKKSMVLAVPCGQRVRLPEGFRDQRGARSQSDLRVGCVLLGEN